MTKICSKCRIEKDVSEFHKSRDKKDGLASWCKMCCSERNKQRTKDGYGKVHYQRYKDKYLANKKAYYQENKEELKRKNRERYRKNRETILAKEKEKYYSDPVLRLRRGLGRIRKETGLSLDEIQEFYNTQFAKQNGCCAICGRHETELNTRLDIDHDHETNELRGLLCSGCNLGIGNLRDDAEVCLKAYMYLRKAKVGNVGTERSSKAPKYDEEIT